MEHNVELASSECPDTARDDVVRRSDTTLRTLVLLACLLLILAGPFLAGRYRYAATYNKLRAEVDVATEALPELSSRLNDFVLASRLVAKRVGPSVVSIFRPSQFELIGQGSGVIVDSEGYIVTNYHVIRPRRNGQSLPLRVRLSDGREQNATLIGHDDATDLAVLKIDLPDLIAAEWGDSDELEVGDLVWALGSPFGLDQSITFGIVSAEKRRRGRGLETSVYSEYLQTDAAVNPGNSGGPLVNVEGRIVGINAAIVGDAYQGVSFAIPSSLAREKYEQLRQHGHIERGFIGIEPRHVPDEWRERLHLARDQGVYVAHVNLGQPAAMAGMRPRDVVLQWNDHIAQDPTELSRTIADTKIGSTAHVVVVRPASERSDNDADVERVELTIVVGRRSDFAQ
jgi:S1-C subfamily serine protease